THPTNARPRSTSTSPTGSLWSPADAPNTTTPPVHLSVETPLRLGPPLPRATPSSFTPTLVELPCLVPRWQRVTPSAVPALQRRLARARPRRGRESSHSEGGPTSRRLSSSAPPPDARNPRGSTIDIDAPVGGYRRRESARLGVPVASRCDGDATWVVTSCEAAESHAAGCVGVASASWCHASSRRGVRVRGVGVRERWAAEEAGRGLGGNAGR